MDFHYTVTTDKSIKDAIAALEANLKEKKFGVLWHLDLTAKLKEKGVTGYPLPYHILEVCQPSKAAGVLNRNKLAGYFLPCKLTVYRTENRTTRIGLAKPTALIGLLDDPGLTDTAKKVETILIDVLDESK
ncbi:DUF302 domain-containing protein [Sporolactobacillus vineae]|uniref:DUF302 domain-containing protein n=1 Tax=Sporolactobacillus vineae TaxID=444463 RepID=UPI00028A0B14|nr:DUF302 domain-containing protein [Sporolactobacillus vineae]